MYRWLAPLLNDSLSLEKGAEDIAAVFNEGDTLPDALQDGPFREENTTGRSSMSGIQADLDDMHEKMKLFLQDDSNWQYGYAYVPVEWIKD